MKNIVLIGFMGSGKSSVSLKLADILKRKVFSTDVLVEESDGRLITQIFEESGEDFFRDLERKVVYDLALKKGIILDCGGGVVMDKENVCALKRNGVLFFLSANAQQIYKIVRNKKKRPLLNVINPLQTIEDMLKIRQPVYEQVADYILDTNQKSVEDICQMILPLVT